LPCSDRGTGAQVQHQRNIPLDTHGHLNRCEHGTNWPRLSEDCQAQAEPNRYLCRLARHELRVSFDRRPDMQLQRPRNIQLHTPQHFDLCGHGTRFASLSEGCQALAELNRYHRRLARHELLDERRLRSSKSVKGLPSVGRTESKPSPSCAS
jgi:hypothetical protein